MLHALFLSSLIAAATTDDRGALAAELAQAIASEHAPGAKVYVGELPPGAHAPAPLPKYTLLGSAVQTLPVSQNGDTQVYTAYYDAGPNARTAADDYGKLLARSGWHESAMRKMLSNAITPASGGFAVTSPVYEAVHAHHMYCKSNGFIETSAYTWPSHVLTVDYGTGAQAATLCELSDMAGTLFGNPAPSPPPLPTLNAPQGVTMRPTIDLGAAFFAPSSRASITTTSSIASVGSQFAQQFTASGWQAQPAASNATAYVQVFTHTEKGRHYQAVLSIVTSGKPQQYDATVRERDLDRAPSTSVFGLPF